MLSTGSVEWEVLMIIQELVTVTGVVTDDLERPEGHSEDGTVYVGMAEMGSMWQVRWELDQVQPVLWRRKLAYE